MGSQRESLSFCGRQFTGEELVKRAFAKYHAALAFSPDTPYPLGSPAKYVHPGVIKADKGTYFTFPYFFAKSTFP